MKGKNYEIITYEMWNMAVGGNFLDEKTYDPRGDFIRPNTKLLLISDKELSQRTKRVSKEKSD